MGSRCFKGAQRYVRQEDEEKAANERSIASPQPRPVDTPDGFSAAASPPFPATAERRRDRVRPTANKAREKITQLLRRRSSKPDPTFTRAPEPPDVPWPTPKWPE
eukprot:Protomagalhaensia_sp_Gyna_25__3870@NODE_3479_length_562_cov_27_277247_g2931_i0_p1_GENE_NODE_3479_length_562_cov_27_277247_g2931_i0NODE_3479_length_562_cov_27_277247_g2931_i0_p1_ORF_typecomplete_len105_score11_53CBP_BcsO/PF17037_5/0_036_NODE_3479_length_562_cov_27_277247_g2931_i0208522